MATAVALESTGASVTLIESRKSLGGRASSFEDPQSGETLDNCQHVLLGCCTNLLDFYRRVGVEHLVRYERTVHFVDQKGNRHHLTGIPGLPAPLHLGPSFMAFSALTLAERIKLSMAMLAMLRLGKTGRLALGDMSFGQWLDDHHQPDSLVEKMYDPILIGSLNEECRLASAAYAIQVFQDAMLANADGYVIGLPACPLGELYAKLPCTMSELERVSPRFALTREKRLGLSWRMANFCRPTRWFLRRIIMPSSMGADGVGRERFSLCPSRQTAKRADSRCTPVV